LKTILILSAGNEAIFGIKRAKDLGYKVVGLDGNPAAPGFAFVDEKIIASTYDIEDIIEKVQDFNKKNHIDGVLSIAADVPNSVAAVAAELGLLSITKVTARICSDKFLMKETFRAAGIKVPDFKKVSSLKDLKEFIKNDNLSYVLKPVDSRGARGVFKISSKSNLLELFNKSLSYSKVKRLILEEYLEGPQISTESIIINKKVHNIAYSDRNYEFLHKYAPNIIENGGDMPSNISKQIKSNISEIIKEIVNLLGIKNGTLKGDIVIHKDIPYVIEVAPRLSGGFFCTHQIPLHTGLDFLGLAIKQCAGDLRSIDYTNLKPRIKNYVCSRFWFPEEGIIKEIGDYKKYKSIKNVEYIDIFVKEGEKIGPINSHPSRAGVVITSGNNREDAIKLANKIISEVQIKTY